MESNLTEISTNQFTLLDYINVFKKYKKYIFLISGLVTLITIILVFFVMKPIYEAKAVVKTSSKQSGLSSLLSGGSVMPDLGDIGDLTSSGGSSKELALYENILLSRRNVEETITKFNLNSEWEFKFIEDAIKNFRTNVLDIKKDKLAGTMEISVLDDNPQRAKDIADFLVTQLNKINIQLNIQNAKNNREFIEQRYNLSKESLKSAEDSMRDFQEVNGIAPDVQTKVVIQSEIQIEAEIKSEEVKLDLMKKIISPDQIEVKMQEEKINSLKKQLSEINNSESNTGLLSLKGKPDVLLRYARLLREVEIQNKILVFLLPMYEQAKIEENRQTPSVLILDQPYVPEKKVKPKRLTLTLIFLMIGFAASYSYFVVFEKWRLYKINNSI